MPRKPRLLIKDACYHIISRGIDQKQIFLDDLDYERYLGLLAKYKRKFESKLFGWCLMPNHTHLIISSNLLSNLMHAINFSYAQYFNFKYDRIGYLWQNRFKSYIVQEDKYLINLINYLEYNPVRAKIIANPEEYVWSSYRPRVLGKDEFRLLDFIEF